MEQDDHLRVLHIDVHLVVAPLLESFDVDAVGKKLTIKPGADDNPLLLRYDHACVCGAFRESASTDSASVLFIDTNFFEKPVVLDPNRPWDTGSVVVNDRGETVTNVAAITNNIVMQARVKGGKSSSSGYSYDLLMSRRVPSLSSTPCASGGVVGDVAVLDTGITAAEIVYATAKTLYAR